MFKTAIHAEIEELADFSWKIQSNIETASYPLDRYKSKQDMIDVMYRYLNTNPKYPDDTVLVLREGKNPAAVVILDVDSENRYIQASGIYASDNLHNVYSELKSWCCLHFEGFNLQIGLPPENNQACKSIMDIGGKLIENSGFFRLDPQDFVPIQSDMDVRLLSLDDFDEFAVFVNEADKDIPPEENYWNAERIHAEFDIWRIYTLHIEGEMVGCATFINSSSYKEYGEIFRCSVTSKYCTTVALLALLTKGLEAEFNDGKKYILYAVNTEEEIEREAAVQSGFKQIGSYICYQIACI